MISEIKEVKSLIIEVDGVNIATADEQGVVTYADGYDAATVVDAIAQLGVHLLETMPVGEGSRYGIWLRVEETKTKGAKTMSERKLSKLIEDLQQGASGFKQLQSEVDFLVEQTGSTEQGQKVLEKFSTLWRERFGSYDPELGIIGETDVVDDMGNSVVGGG